MNTYILCRESRVISVTLTIVLFLWSAGAARAFADTAVRGTPLFSEPISSVPDSCLGAHLCQLPISVADSARLARMFSNPLSVLRAPYNYDMLTRQYHQNSGSGLNYSVTRSETLDNPQATFWILSTPVYDDIGRKIVYVSYSLSITLTSQSTVKVELICGASDDSVDLQNLDCFRDSFIPPYSQVQVYYRMRL